MREETGRRVISLPLVLDPPRTVKLKIESTPSGAWSFTVQRMGTGVGAVADAIVELSGWTEGTEAEQAELRGRIETMLAEGGDRIVVERWAPDDETE